MSTVLFDLDGTLTDPAVGITRSLQHALRSEGLVIEDPNELTCMIGPPIRDNLAALGLAPDAIERAVEVYRTRHADIGLYECQVIAGMPEVLAALADGERTLAVATAKPTDQAVRTLEHFGLDPWFAAVGGATLDGSRSHKDQIIGHTLGLVGEASPGALVMVGDRRHDIEGARACGLGSIAVRWGYGTEQELVAAQPDHVVSTPAELAVLLLSIS